MTKIIVNYTNELKNVNAGGLDLDISVVKDKPIGEWFTASLGWNGLFAEVYDLCNGACAESEFDVEFNGSEADTAVFDECLKNRGFLNGLENKEEPADIETCRKAAESGDAKAQYLMGEHYWAEYCGENNTGVKWEDAEKWYVMAINQNYLPACFRFGQIHFSANNQNYGIGFMYKAAQQGYVPAMLELGKCYEPAEIYDEACDVAGIRESTWFRASFDYYKNAAEFGCKEAQNKVMDF
ncbi:MAG: hypothetical protein LUD77_00115 [Clostridiales bacterium]|nr:hypothetical protein [Clostridiales bacterium]